MTHSHSMKTRISIIAASVALIGASPPRTAGYSVAITNPSFESPGYDYGIPSGWMTTGAAKTYNVSQLGAQLPPVDGPYAAFSDMGDGAFFQTPTTIAADTQYELTVLVGGRASWSGFGFRGHMVQLRDASDGSVLTQNAMAWDAPGAPDGFWETVRVAYFAETARATHGLEVALIANNGGGGTRQTWFDAVQLTATPIPEPSTLALLGIGAFGLVAHRRRRRRLAA